MRMVMLIDHLTEPYRNLIQASYDHFISSNFEHKSTGEIVLFAFATVIFYWFLGLFYLFLDLTKRPKFLVRFKTHPSENSQFTAPELYKLIRQVLFNQLLVLGVAYLLILLKYRYTNVQTELPTLCRFVFEFVIFFLITEVLFYYLHRVLHHRLVYKHVHKVHHEWKTSIALEAIYAHPLEHLLNFGIALIGPNLLHSHTLTIILWFTITVTLNLMDHSGYNFPYSPLSTVFHDFHHAKFNTNYGLIGLMDWLHSTDDKFRQSKYN